MNLLFCASLHTVHNALQSTEGDLCLDGASGARFNLLSRDRILPIIEKKQSLEMIFLGVVCLLFNAP